MTEKLIDLPDQPDGIEDDSRDLPDPLRAAERIGEYIAANGDGMYDRIGNIPLYARDLEVLRRTVEKLITAPPAGMHGIALEEWVSDQLSKATEERIAAGEVNRHAAVKAPNGCDECSVEPGETHRYPTCPGAKAGA